MRILITAFDAFGGEDTNVSQEILRALPDFVGGTELVKEVLPTVFGEASRRAAETALRCRPDAILCLGQAAGRDAVTPERAAINIMDAERPDNAGNCPCDEPIDPEGPAAYFSTLPIREMVRLMRERGIPAKISNTAGTFVCNSLMYGMLRFTSQHCPSVPCGFVHLPRLDTQTGQGEPGLAKEVLLQAAETAVEAVKARTRDVFRRPLS